jgi:N4-gp56 family major capsid protein
VGTVSCLNVIAVSDIRRSIYELKHLDVQPYEGADYVAIINTDTAEDLVGDSTWINFHQYAAPGQANLYTGEIGKIYGCRFVETTQGPCTRGSNDGSTASSLAYGTVIMGKGFYGVTELDGGIKTYITQGAQKSDPLNQTTTYGWKANFIAKLLNTSAGLVFWAGSGSGDSTTVGDESASGSVTRYKYPASY